MANLRIFSEETNTFSVKSSLPTNLMALFTRFWAWSSVSQDIIGEAGGRFSRPDHILSLCLFPTTGEKPSVRLPRKAHPISKTLNVKTLVGRARQAHPPYHYIYNPNYSSNSTSAWRKAERTRPSITKECSSCRRREASSL